MLKTTRDISVGELKATLKSLAEGKNNPPFAEEKVGGHTLYSRKSEFGVELTFCVPEPKVVVLAKAAVLRKVLTRGKPPDSRAGFRAALAAADFDNASVIVHGGGEGAVGVVAIFGLEGMCIQTNFVGGAVVTKTASVYPSADAAEAARQRSEAALKEPPPFPDAAESERRRSAKTSRSGAVVHLVTSVSEKTFLDPK